MSQSHNYYSILIIRFNFIKFQKNMQEKFGGHYCFYKVYHIIALKFPVVNT